MIELFTAYDWIEAPEVREEVFEFRHKVFVERLGWEIGSHDDMEFDEYDALLPIYMLARDELGNLKALWRLLPTTGPYMLRNTFSMLLDGVEAPRADNVWEISRFAFDPASVGAENICSFAQIAGELFCALGEFGLENGIREAVAVYDPRITPILRHLGCPPKWTGEMKRVGKSMAIASGFEVSNEQLFKIRKKASIHEPVLIPHRKTRKAA